MPFVHRLKGRRRIGAWIRAFSRLGLGKYRMHRQQTDVSLDSFSAYHADFILELTNYRTCKALYSMAETLFRTVSYGYTSGLYTTKLRLLTGKPARQLYGCDSPSTNGALALFFLKYLSSVTLYLRKQ